MAKRTEAVEVRHSRSCGSRTGGKCSCKPTYEAGVWDRRAIRHARSCGARTGGDECSCTPTYGRRIRKTFPTLAAAKAWRTDALVALARGTLRAATPTTLRAAWEAWEAGAEGGAVRNRSGDRFKPSTIRGYRAAMHRVVLPELGAVKLAEITRRDVQALADRLVAAGRDPSTVRNAIMPVRVVYRRALRDGVVAANPVDGVELPATRGRRDRIAAPDEAARLIAALPEGDRALWATAVYAGLRRGELMALRWEDVDLAGGTIAVERSYDPKARQFVEVKSRAGRRRVPLAAALRDHLVDHKLRTERNEGLVFGRDGNRPFDHSSLRARAAQAWAAETKRLRQEGPDSPGLGPITLHECRHTFASLMIAAGVGAKALSQYMGHAGIQITLDRYGHLMPGSEDEAASLLDAYLARADTAARLAQLEGGER